MLAHAALGWAVAKVIGAATVRSRVSAVVTALAGTALAGTAAGLAGFAAGPVGSSVLLALMAGSVTAAAMWAAPTTSLLIAMRDE